MLYCAWTGSNYQSDYRDYKRLFQEEEMQCIPPTVKQVHEYHCIIFLGVNKSTALKTVSEDRDQMKGKHNLKVVAVLVPRYASGHGVS